MKIPVLATNGKKEEEVELPLVFSTDFRKDLIHKAFINLNYDFYELQRVLDLLKVQDIQLTLILHPQ